MELPQVKMRKKGGVKEPIFIVMYKNNPKNQMRGTQYFKIELSILRSLHSFISLE
jgi:hypothetical protein